MLKCNCDTCRLAWRLNKARHGKILSQWKSTDSWILGIFAEHLTKDLLLVQILILLRFSVFGEDKHQKHHCGANLINTALKPKFMIIWKTHDKRNLTLPRGLGKLWTVTWRMNGVMEAKEWGNSRYTGRMKDLKKILRPDCKDQEKSHAR